MELLKCGQCGDRPGLLVTVTDRAAGTSINLCYECYKKYAGIAVIADKEACGDFKHVKNGKAERVIVVYEEDEYNAYGK